MLHENTSQGPTEQPGAGTPLVFCGPPDRARDQKLFENALRLWDPPRSSFLYLAPSTHRRNQLRERFFSCYPAAFDVPILTLSDLAKMVLKLDPEGGRLIGKSNRLAILEQIIRSRPKLAQLGPQILKKLDQYIVQLKAKNLSDSNLVRLREAQLGVRLEGPDRELSEASCQYLERLLDERLEDTAGSLCLLQRNLNTSQLDLKGVFPGLRRVVWEGVAPRWPVELGILRALATAVPDLQLSVDCEKPLDEAEEPLASLYGLLLTLDADIRFCSGGVQSQIRLCNPDGQLEEVREAAQGILRLLNEHSGLGCSQIGIACGTAGRYKLLVEETLSEIGVPCVFLSGQRASQYESVRLFLLFVQVLLEDFPREPLLDLVQHLNPTAGWGPSECRLLEELSVKAGVIGGFNSWSNDLLAVSDRLCSRLIERGELERSRRIQRVLNAFQACIHSLKLQHVEPRPLREWASSLCSRFFAQCRYDTGQSPSADRRALMLLLRDLEVLSGCWDDEKISKTRLLFLIRRAANELRISESSRAGVAVGSPSELMHSQFKFVFWLGLTDDPNQAGVTGHDRGATLEFEQCFRKILARAETAFVSYPKRIGPRKAGPHPILATATQVAFAEPIETKQSVSSWDRQRNVQRGKRAILLRQSHQRSIYSGRLESNSALESFRSSLFKNGVLVSPSQLEDYFQCGYRFFLRRVLGVEPQPLLQIQLDPMLRGILVHRILARFSQKCPPRQSGEPKDLWLKRGRRTMLEVADKVLSEVSSKNRENQHWRDFSEKLTRGLNGQGAGMLSLFLEQESNRIGRNKVAVESRLEPRLLGYLDALPEPLPVSLKGFVDRIDYFPDRLVVVDYKTGFLNYQQRVEWGWGFQLPLYGWMVSGSLGLTAEELAFYYFRLPLDLDYRAVKLSDGEDLGGLMEYYRQRALSVAGQLYEGVFPLSHLPPHRSSCRTCDYQGVCGIRSSLTPLLDSSNLLREERVLLGGRLNRAVLENQPETVT